MNPCTSYSVCDGDTRFSKFQIAPATVPYPQEKYVNPKGIDLGCMEDATGSGIQEQPFPVVSQLRSPGGSVGLALAY